MTPIKQMVTKNIWTALTICAALSIFGISQRAVAQNTFPNPGPGNVGIGTTSPSDPLQVSSPSGVNIRSTDSTNNTSSYLTQVSQWSVWAINRNPITGTKPDSSRTAAQIYFSAASGDSSIHFHTSTTNGADPTERMVIDKNGNVGIGTSTPNRKLELIQDVGGLSFEAGSSSPNSGAIRFGDNTGWKLHFGRSRESNGGALNSGTSGALVTIQDNGNFGIGTTSPTYLLDVAGTVRSSSGGFRFPDNTVQTSAVNYGSSAGTAVQGNTSITLTAGDGMSGGGPLTLGRAVP